MQHTFLPALADPVFPLRIAPGAAVAHPPWRRARAAALETLTAGNHAVLVGAPGSGKSLLLMNLAHTLREAGEPVHMIGRAGASGDALAGGILLVDEADALGTDALAVLCVGAGPVLLAMLPGGPERLPQRPRPVRSVALDRLAPLEVAKFIAVRLAAAGRPADLLEPEAVLALAQHSGGLPRLVNVFGAAAVFLAGLDGSPRVKLRHVEEAASMRADPAEDATPVVPLPVEPPSVELFAALPSPRGSMLRRRAALGSMVAASGVLFLLPWLTSKRAAGLPQVGDGAAQVAQAGTGASSPAPPALAVAESEASKLRGGDAVSAGLSEQSEPEPPVVVADVASPPRVEPVRQADSPPDSRPVVVAADAPALFRGTIFNETMGQGGRVSLVIRKQAQTGAITAKFDASQGLSGSGTLAGRVSGSGRITASGQLLMGKNAFLCDLSGTLDGNTLTGSASFVRDGNSMVYRSRFNLVRV